MTLRLTLRAQGYTVASQTYRGGSAGCAFQVRTRAT